MTSNEQRGLDAETPSPSSQMLVTVPCPCTLIEQDETCPVGYPSLLCDECDGKGHIPAPRTVAGGLVQAGRDIRILLTQIDWLEELTGEKIEGEDAALVSQIRQSWTTATPEKQP